SRPSDPGPATPAARITASPAPAPHRPAQDVSRLSLSAHRPQPSQIADHRLSATAVPPAGCNSHEHVSPGTLSATQAPPAPATQAAPATQVPAARAPADRPGAGQSVTPGGYVPAARVPGDWALAAGTAAAAQVETRRQLARQQEAAAG